MTIHAPVLGAPLLGASILTLAFTPSLTALVVCMTLPALCTLVALVTPAAGHETSDAARIYGSIMSQMRTMYILAFSTMLWASGLLVAARFGLLLRYTWIPTAAASACTFTWLACHR